MLRYNLETVQGGELLATVERSEDVVYVTDAELHFEQSLYRLLRDAKRAGLIITIENRPQHPLAMRNHLPHVEVRARR